MINNYSYDTNTPEGHKSVDITELNRYNYSEVLPTKEVRHISNSNKLSVHSITMALDCYFKLTIEGLLVDKNMKMEGSKKQSGYGEFLPVESMQLTPVSVENRLLNIGIFSDLPILNKRRMGRLKITLLDDQFNIYETAVMSWFRKSVANGFVAPLSEIVRSAEYYEYTPTGKLSKHYRFFIIPDGEININRQYADNKLKVIEFGTIIIGDIEDVLKGENSSYGESSVGTLYDVGTGSDMYYVILQNGQITGKYAGKYFKDENIAIKNAYDDLDLGLQPKRKLNTLTKSEAIETLRQHGVEITGWTFTKDEVSKPGNEVI